jgi:hypothetical protein
VQLATHRVSNRCAGLEPEPSRARALGGQELAKAAFRQLARPPVSEQGGWCQPDTERIRSDLTQLVLVNASTIFKDAFNGERNDRNCRPASRRELQHIVATSFHAQAWQCAATRAWFIHHRDAVAKLITNQRLHPIAEIGKENAC